MKFGIAHMNANWHDWERHLAGNFGTGAATPDHQLTRETFEMTDLAEELGFDSVFSPEHHFDPYCMAPDVRTATLLLCWPEQEDGRGQHGRGASLARPYTSRRADRPAG